MVVPVCMSLSMCVCHCVGLSDCDCVVYVFVIQGMCFSVVVFLCGHSCVVACTRPCLYVVVIA